MRCPDRCLHQHLAKAVPDAGVRSSVLGLREGEKMNIKLTALCLGGFLTLTSFVARPALADEWNKKTEFQFSAAVQIPGRTLAAGKYVFQLADSDSNRNIVRV